eukprot:44105-Chlamydomonas_euryale.AAC.3
MQSIHVHLLLFDTSPLWPENAHKLRHQSCFLPILSAKRSLAGWTPVSSQRVSGCYWYVHGSVGVDSKGPGAFSLLPAILGCFQNLKGASLGRSRVLNSSIRGSDTEMFAMIVVVLVGSFWCSSAMS